MKLSTNRHSVNQLVSQPSQYSNRFYPSNSYFLFSFLLGKMHISSGGARRIKLLKKNDDNIISSHFSLYTPGFKITKIEGIKNKS